jgi:ribosome-associated toxin RatA of RatAB toxin-antitoxin module
MLFLFDSQQMARLPLIDLVSITEKNKGKNCAQNTLACSLLHTKLRKTNLLTAVGKNILLNLVNGAFMAISSH